MGRSATHVAAAIVAALIAGGPAHATNYNITMVSGHGTHLPWIKLITEYYIPEVNNRLKAAGGQHKINWQEAYSGTIVKLGGELQAVREGVAEMAHVYTIFEPGNLPLLTFTHLTPFSTYDVQGLSKIVLDMHSQMKELKDHWARQGQVFLGAVVVDSVHLYTKKPVSTIDELKGMKVGAAGSASLWANGIGMVPVQGDFATHYNNVRTGVYDSLFAFTTGTYPIKIHEVAKYLTKVDIGATFIGAITINAKLYDSMPPDVQRILQEVGAEYTRRVAATLTALAEQFEKKMAAEGAIISDFPKDQRQKWAATMPNIAQDWVKRNEERKLPARIVLKTYLDKLRGSGQTPLRNWDQE
jgi:TRAP-type C4-dicarboxylate transport system substrate-binding protein